jgi:hypothetical protein
MAIPKEKRPKQVYREGYKPGSMMVSQHLLPERLPYMAEGFKVAMEVMAAGHMDDGREFQEIRVYTREVADEQPLSHDPARPIPLVPEVDRAD